MNPSSSTSRNINVGKTERALSAVAGSLLLYYVTKKHKADALLSLAGGYLLYRAISGHCSAYSLLQKQKEGMPDHPRNINVRTSVTVNRPRDEVYAFWRNLENLPLFMRHLDHVDELDPITSAWKIKIPGGMGDVRWEAQIVKEERGSEISWQSAPGASIENVGKINFSDTPSGATRIDVLFSYRAPMGVVGERLSRLLTPMFRNIVERDIHRVKEFLEDYRVVEQ